MDPNQNPEAPHVVILPFPLPGHVKPMLNLANLLSQNNIKVTFINSHHNHQLLQNTTDLPSLCRQFPGLQFESFPDGLPPGHPRIGPSSVNIFFDTRTTMKPLLRELLVRLESSKERGSTTCVIADAMMCFAVDVGKELGIPVSTFSTHSSYGFWAILHTSKLIQAGEVPFQDEDMDKPITCIPGMEGVLRRRDLPSHCRLQLDNPMIEFNLNEAKAVLEASSLILNTFEELDAPLISSLKTLFPKVYTIGPLHALFKTHLVKDPSSSPSSTNSSALRKEDRSCMTWLDKQPLKSVIYVSFGTLAELSRTRLMEFWYGLVNSGIRFLWVIRPGLVTGEDEEGGADLEAQVPSELKDGTKERGCVVGWAPQEEVLAHPAVGGFLTHGGWNSTLESIYEGVPMIVWAMVADQQVTGRCVSEIWRIGMDMKDSCERGIVEKMVRELMKEGKKRNEMMRRASEISKVARDSVKIGGSSHHGFEMLVNDLRQMKVSRQ